MRRLPKRAPLTRDRIIDAALAIVRTDGADALTMRGLARALGSPPMSLYRHVADLDEVLAGVVDRLTAELDLPPPDHDWQATLSAAAWAIRGALRDHPGLARVLVARSLTTPGMLRVIEAVYGALLRAGLDPPTAVKAHAALLALVAGSALMEHNLAEGVAIGDDPTEEGRRFHARLLTEGRSTYPNLARAAAHWPEVSRDEAFAFALDRFLDGIAAHAAQQAEAPGG